MTSNIKKLIKKKNAAQDTMNTNHAFAANTWYFDAKESINTFTMMSEEELKEFNYDTRKFDWEMAGKLFAYGTSKYYAGINLVNPTGDL